MKRERVAGYYVVNSHGETRRGFLNLEQRDGRWFCADDWTGERKEVIAQEGDELPSGAIAIVSEDEHTFVADPGECERIGMRYDRLRG